MAIFIPEVKEKEKEMSDLNKIANFANMGMAAGNTYNAIASVSGNQESTAMERKFQALQEDQESNPLGLSYKKPYKAGY